MLPFGIVFFAEVIYSGTVVSGINDSGTNDSGINESGIFVSIEKKFAPGEENEKNRRIFLGKFMEMSLCRKMNPPGTDFSRILSLGDIFFCIEKK